MFESLRLENSATLNDLENFRTMIDYWVEEMQENAMADVPIMILFCTKIQQKSLIETMIEERDKAIKTPGESKGGDSSPLTHKMGVFDYMPVADRGGTCKNSDDNDDMQERINEAIKLLIDETIMKYKFFRNIHVIKANDQRVLSKYGSNLFNETDMNKFKDPIAFLREVVNLTQKV